MQIRLSSTMTACRLTANSSPGQRSVTHGRIVFCYCGSFAANHRTAHPKGVGWTLDIPFPTLTPMYGSPMNINRETAPAVGRQDARSMLREEPRWRTHPDIWNASGKSAECAGMTSWSTPGLGKASEFTVEGSDLSATLTYYRTSARGEFWVDGRHALA